MQPRPLFTPEISDVSFTNTGSVIGSLAAVVLED
jgi:hypothetical protein